VVCPYRIAATADDWPAGTQHLGKSLADLRRHRQSGAPKIVEVSVVDASDLPSLGQYHSRCIGAPARSRRLGGTGVRHLASTPCVDVPAPRLDCRPRPIDDSAATHLWINDDRPAPRIPTTRRGTASVPASRWMSPRCSPRTSQIRRCTQSARRTVASGPAAIAAAARSTTAGSIRGWCSGVCGWPPPRMRQGCPQWRPPRRWAVARRLRRSIGGRRPA
jgi:hypothetical protein